MPKMLAEFLVYLEAENVCHIHDIQEIHLKAYLNYLYERPNYKWDGGLSKNYIRKQVQVIKKFSRYLTESGQESFVVKLRIKGKASNVGSVLSRLEIKRLYDATEDNVMGLRDRAILALYYGCGLRKNEGINVNVSDVLLDKDMIYVRKGKGYKERYVPLNSHIKTDLENYIHLARPYLTDDKKKDDDALLLSIKGKRLSVFWPLLVAVVGGLFYLAYYLGGAKFDHEKMELYESNKSLRHKDSVMTAQVNEYHRTIQKLEDSVKRVNNQLKAVLVYSTQPMK